MIETQRDQPDAGSGVLAIDKFVNQLELAEASGIFQWWNLNTLLRQRQKKLRLGLGFGIKAVPGFTANTAACPAGISVPNSNPAVRNLRIRLVGLVWKNLEKLRSVVYADNERPHPQHELVNLRSIVG